MADCLRTPLCYRHRNRVLARLPPTESLPMAESLPSRPLLYPETDGQPMPDADYQGDAYRYIVEALRVWFQDRPDVYVSGDLFVYLEEGNPRNCIAPDAFVVFGAGNHPRETYRLWEEPGGVPDFVLEVVSPTTWRVDLGAKRERYASLGVREYWLHDPHGRHLQPALAGFRLSGGVYVPLPAIDTPKGITLHSDVLGLDLSLDGEDLRLRDPGTGRHLPTYAEARADLRNTEADLRNTEADLRNARARLAELERALRRDEED